MANWWKIGVGLLVAVGVCFAGLRYLPGSGPFAGTWKAIAIQGADETTLFLLRIAGSAGSPTIDVLDSPVVGEASVESIAADDNGLRFDINADGRTLRIALMKPKEGQEYRLGNLLNRDSYELLRLEPTAVKELDTKKLQAKSPGFVNLRKGLETRDRAEAEAGIRATLEKYGDKPVAQTALLTLIQIQMVAGASSDDLDKTAKRYLDAAAIYGREIEMQATGQLARTLASGPPERTKALVIEYALRAEKLLTKEDPPMVAVAILKTAAKALRQAGRGDEAKPLLERIAALDAQLDAAFEKRAVPFKPESPRSRRGGSERVVLTELFTGAQCPPCVAADVAFDAALQVYKPSRVILLQYHLHVPGPDPLTSPASIDRQNYFGDDIGGTPTFMLDGKVAESNVIGGPASRGEVSYGALRQLLDKAGEVPAQARIKLTAHRKDDGLDLEAEVSDVAKPGPKIRLCFVLAEDIVHYAAPNGQRIHHHVVRANPGGSNGFPIEQASLKKAVHVDLATLKKELTDYLDQFARKQPFPDEERPLDLRHFVAVGFVQDDATHAILQAASVDIGDAGDR